MTTSRTTSEGTRRRCRELAALAEAVLAQAAALVGRDADTVHRRWWWCGPGAAHRLVVRAGYRDLADDEPERLLRRLLVALHAHDGLAVRVPPGVTARLEAVGADLTLLARAAAPSGLALRLTTSAVDLDPSTRQELLR